MIEARIDSGIEIAMMIGAAPAAEEQQDHECRQRRGDDRLAHDAGIAARTKIDWSPIGSILRLGGTARGPPATWP